MNIIINFTKVNYKQKQKNGGKQMKQGKNLNLKNKNAITLIALVVTIVVLLILAGVTISLLLDENGIIAKSKDARNANRAGAIKEEITLWKADKFAADNGAGSH